MTAQNLKNSILQLAMQGKLVEQRAEEGTARELLDQVKEEKELIIKEKKIKKEKLLPKIAKNEIPFEIPKSWEWVRLGDISSYAHPKQKICAKDIDKEMWSLDLEDIEKDTGKIISILRASERKISGDKIIFKKGDILYSKLRPYLLKILVAPNDGICTTEFVPFDTYGEIENEYIMWVLRTPYINYIVNSGSYGVKMPRVGTETMINLLIPLPPLGEQKRIVAKIEELLPYIEKYDKAYSKSEVLNKKFMEDMQKSIFQYAIQGKLVEQRPEEGTGEELYWQIQAEKEKLIRAGEIRKEKSLPEISEDEMNFNIPKTWKWTRFGNVISLLSGTDFKPEEYNDRGIGTVYITGASNLDENGVLISRWTETPRNMAYQGDVLLVCKGSGYGKTIICDIKEAHIARQIMSIKKMDNLDMKYIKYYLDVNFAYLKSKGQGVIPGIDRNTVLNMLFPLPPYKEQKRIVAELEKIMPYCQRLIK